VKLEDLRYNIDDLKNARDPEWAGKYLDVRMRLIAEFVKNAKVSRRVKEDFIKDVKNILKNITLVDSMDLLTEEREGVLDGALKSGITRIDPRNLSDRAGALELGIRTMLEITGGNFFSDPVLGAVTVDGGQEYVLNPGVLSLRGRVFLFSRRALIKEHRPDPEREGIRESQIDLFEHKPFDEASPVVEIKKGMLSPGDGHLTSGLGGEVLALEDSRVMERDGTIYVYLTVVERRGREGVYYSAFTTHPAESFLEIADGRKKQWEWTPLKRCVEKGSLENKDIQEWNVKNFVPFGNPSTVVDEAGRKREIWYALYRPDYLGGRTIRLAKSEGGPAGPWEDAGEYLRMDDDKMGWIGPSVFVPGPEDPNARIPVDFMFFHVGEELQPADGKDHKYYDLRMMVLVRGNPEQRVVINAPILVPDMNEPWYFEGWKPGVMYSNGALLSDYDPETGEYTFDIYYSGSDEYVLRATVTIKIRFEEEEVSTEPSKPAEAIDTFRVRKERYERAAIALRSWWHAPANSVRKSDLIGFLQILISSDRDPKDGHKPKELVDKLKNAHLKAQSMAVNMQEAEYGEHLDNTANEWRLLFGNVIRLWESFLEWERKNGKYFPDNIRPILEELAAMLEEQILFLDGKTKGEIVDDLDGFLEELKKTTTDRDVEITGETLSAIKGSGHMLKLVLANIVSNARDFSEKSVRVNKKVEGGFNVISITDDGPGIPDGQKENIFDYGYSGRNSSGIGLAEAKYIIEDHGGTLSVLSEPGKGATFTIRLPAESRNLTPDDDAPSAHIDTPPGGGLNYEQLKSACEKMQEEGKSYDDIAAFLVGYITKTELWHQIDDCRGILNEMFGEGPPGPERFDAVFIYGLAQKVIPSIVHIMRRGAPTYLIAPAPFRDLSDAQSQSESVKRLLSRNDHLINTSHYLNDSKEWFDSIKKRIDSQMNDFVSDCAEHSTTRWLIRSLDGKKGRDDVVGYLKSSLVSRFSKEAGLSPKEAEKKAQDVIDAHIRVVALENLSGLDDHLNPVVDFMVDIAALEIDRYGKEDQYTEEAPDSLKMLFLALLRTTISNFSDLEKEVTEGSDLATGILSVLFRGDALLKIRPINWSRLDDIREANNALLRSL